MGPKNTGGGGKATIGRAEAEAIEKAWFQRTRGGSKATIERAEAEPIQETGAKRRPVRGQ